MKTAKEFINLLAPDNECPKTGYGAPILTKRSAYMIMEMYGRYVSYEQEWQRDMMINTIVGKGKEFDEAKTASKIVKNSEVNTPLNIVDKVKKFVNSVIKTGVVKKK